MTYGKGPFNIPGVTTKTTTSGDFGGYNTKISQMPVSGQFEILKPITGHTQKSNVTTPVEYKGYNK